MAANPFAPPFNGHPGPRQLWEHDTDWIEDNVTQRPWIAPGYLLRGAVTIVAGPGSAGKSTLMIGWAIALALGSPWNRFAPNQACRVITYNVEDDCDEQLRRFSATLRQFGKNPCALAHKVMRCGPKRVGSLIEIDQETGQFRFNPLMEELEQRIRSFKPDVLMVDPLVELHTADENDNIAMRMVIAMFRTIAVNYNIAVVILHHSRKGAGYSPGDPDTIRGASAVVGGSRISLTVMTMNEDDAKKLGINQEDRFSFFRVDGAKQNYAPILEAEWFQRIVYGLDNGDLVAAAVPWTPPKDAVDGLTEDAIKDKISIGINGEPFSPRISYKEPRSIAFLLKESGIETPASQKQFVSTLQADGFTIQPFRNRDRNRRIGLRSPDGQPNAEWIPA